MKKILSLLIVFIMCFSLFACSANNDIENNKTNETKNTTETKTDETEDIGDLDFTVELVESVFDENNCHISLIYPVVSGLKDKDKLQLLNEKLYYYCYRMYKNKCLVSDDGVTFNYLTIDSAITAKTSNYFGALFSISCYSDDSGHDDPFTFTINCLVDKCEIIDAKDLFKDFLGIRELFLNGKFIQVYGMTTLLENVKYSDLMSKYYPEYDIYPNVFFEEGIMGLNIDVAYVYGGYAGFTIKLSEVAKYLDSKYEFISELSKEN